jgi:transglutaminase superfamily protein
MPRIIHIRPTDSSVPGPFSLQPHVYLCRGKRHWVILDVNRDKYLCVDRNQFEALGPSLRGWEESMGPSRRDAAPVPEDAVALANDLLSLDILSDRAAQAKDALSTAYPLSTEAIDPDLPERSRRLAAAHAPSFFWGAARASRELRRQRFQLIVEHVRARKSRNAGRTGALDFDRARSLVSVFGRLRLFYPRSYLCLFDSLALIHFLARFHVYPDWVFGVNADPFEAHCWVQAGNVVLNDTVARVSAFTPIMYI